MHAGGEWNGKGKGKKVVKNKKHDDKHGDEKHGTKQGPGLGNYGKGLKSVEKFFSPQSEVKLGVDAGNSTSKTKELSTLEYKLVYIDGLSRAEARHVAMATMASLQPVQQPQHSPVQEGVLCSNESSQYA